MRDGICFDFGQPLKTEENEMRKKSHISLATYLIGELESEQLDRHKKAFYLGSILPDTENVCGTA